MAVSETVSVDLVVNTQNAQSNMASFSRQVGLSVVGIQELVNMAKAAAGAVIDFAQEAVAAYGEQEKAATNLDSVLRSTQGAVGMTSRELQDLATSLQKTTLYGDETTIQAEALMLTFRQIGNTVFPQAIKAAQDMATVMKMDLNSATIMIGKALNEPIQGIGALRRVGIQLTDQQEAMIKKFMQANDVASAQAVIMQELNSEFGGAAEMAGKMATGSLVQLSNAFGDLKETIGGLVITALLPAIQGLQQIIEMANEALVKMSGINRFGLTLPKGPNVPVNERNIPQLGGWGGGNLPNLPMAQSQTVNPYLIFSSGYTGENVMNMPFGYPSTTYSGEDYDRFRKMIDQQDAFAEAVKNGVGYMEDYVPTIGDVRDSLKEVNTEVDAWILAQSMLNESLAYAAGNAFVTSMQQFGEDAYRAGISINTLGAAISNMGQSILNMLPQLFLQAGLQLLIASNGTDPRGWALIAMAGTVAVTSGYVNAAVEDSKTSKSVSPSVSASSNVTIHNYSGQQATVTETPKPGGGKITEIVIGAVKNSMANGGFDSIMSSRYGARYAGVRR